MKLLTPKDPRGYLAKTKAYGTVLNENDGFRRGTKIKRFYHNFIITNGGLGDYICFASAFQYIANECPHVLGRVFVREPFRTVLDWILKDNEGWDVYNTSEVEKHMKPKELLVNPGQWHHYVNPVGAHLMDIGWMFYANRSEPFPEYRMMPDLTDYKHHTKKVLPSKYAVLTPGWTAPTRKQPVWAVNEIAKYLVSKGITPVYLGKQHFAEGAGNTPDISKIHPDYHAKRDEDLDTSYGLDLLEDTELLEAVEIMKGAEMVIGLDNGLLHFAGCTQVPIIFGMTITDIEHREIRRPKGKTLYITPDIECAGCQSKQRHVIGNDFKYCPYHDYACIADIFKNDCQEWKDAIDEIIKG